MIDRAISTYLFNDTYLHIDVGGGSTELNLYYQGKKIKSRSFKIGSVRILEHNDSPIVWNDMEKWVREKVKKAYGKVTAVGTGGNITKIFELAKSKPGKTISLKKVEVIRDMIAAHSLEDRIYKLQMNPDRADVIIPASTIYLKVMNWSNSTKILVPEVGLKDGIMLHLYERNIKQQRIKFN